MRVMGEGYREAVSSDDRTVAVYLSVGMGIDTTAADDVQVDGQILEMSDKDDLVDAIYTIEPGLATFEGDGIPTALSNGCIAPPVSAGTSMEVGVWSASISDAVGVIAFGLTLTFGGAQHTSALTVYTAGPDITSAKATYTLADGTTTVKEFSCYAGYIQISEVVTYTRIVISIQALDAPYRHVRISEVEFGASSAISSRELAGEIVLIRESDPTELSAPLQELDISILNVEGTYDPDNPDGRFDRFGIGTPITASYTVCEGAKRWTVPCGRYIIGERRSLSTRLELTAFDMRYTLSTVYASWTMPRGRSIGATLDELMISYSIPHLVDADLLGLMPDEAHTFDDSTSVADDLLTIQQAYEVYCIPDRTGILHITSEWPADGYGTVAPAVMYDWPRPRQKAGYNYVQVGWTSTDAQGTAVIQYASADLRTDVSEVKSVLQISGNPLITTKTRAEDVLSRLVARIGAQEVELSWRGDPAMDLGDTVQIPGRWTQDAPGSYIVTYMEDVFDGSYSSTMRSTS